MTGYQPYPFVPATWTTLSTLVLVLVLSTAVAALALAFADLRGRYRVAVDCPWCTRHHPGVYCVRQLYGYTPRHDAPSGRHRRPDRAELAGATP